MPIVNNQYVSPAWVNGTSPSIDATELLALCNWSARVRPEMGVLRTAIASGSDLDSYTTAGSYAVSSASNIANAPPTASTVFRLDVYNTDNTAANIVQIAVDGLGIEYIRYYASGAFSDWFCVDITQYRNNSAATTATLSSVTNNTVYRFGTLTNLTVSALPSGYYIVFFEFTAGSGITVSFPSATLWNGGTAPTWTAGKKYQISVENGMAVWGEF